LVTYERSRALDRRLDEVYQNADLPLPTGSDNLTSSSDITRTPAPKTPPPLGF
jgi:hypothetical protein